ncbi:MAG TPA: sugar phosphate nucleotidyltransferase [Fimbriimonadaceae bacterium]|nr:sugar phosphate nucleotidyltransferase [Fimbriimonadaceae bacterium]
MFRVAVILAGGSGERFWPLSTPERPKQLLRLSDPERTLLEVARDRAAPIFGVEHLYVVTGSRIGPAIEHSGLIPSGQVFIEPAAKNTLGALCWAVAQLRARGYPDETVMAVLTADHAIGDLDVFETTVRSAMELARETQGLVTIGIKPTRAETGYGYIHRDEPVGAGFRVRRFAEKPPAETARAYVESGESFWNSGMFFWTIGAFLSELRRHVPEASDVVEELAHRPGAFARLPSIAIDRALMEHSENVYVVPGTFSWDDVGSWDSLSRTHPADPRGNILLGESAEIDCSDCIVVSEEIPVGVLGVRDLIIVGTPNGVLVCHKSEAQRVREVLSRFNLPK